MNLIQWRPGSSIKDYPENATVRGVPIDLPMFDSVRAYYEKIDGRNQRHDEQAQDIVDNFDPDKFHPLHWCMKCNEIDDGTHRLEAAQRMGRTEIDVKIGGNCWKFVSANYLPLFRQTIREVMGDKGERDLKWLEACAEKKWPVIDGNVAFHGRTVLDVGCQVGFTAVEAWKRGALGVRGVDVRDKPFSVARLVASMVGSNAHFWLEDWFSNIKHAEKYDIVFCMGVLHYIPDTEYGTAIRKLSEACKETLVIEMRLLESSKGVYSTMKQTLPTREWLIEELSLWGFAPEQTSPITHNSKIGTRELWICRKG